MNLSADVHAEARTKPPPAPNRWLRRLRRIGIIAAVLAIFFAVMAAGTLYYTSRPDFCGSCHIMDPYYESWKSDVHSGKGHATCVDCHYAPGQQHSLMAKFRGFSQLTSYFSGRAGAGRPKAHVQDPSCVRSRCHGDLEFMTTEYEFGDIAFDHAKHLDPQGQSLLQKQNELVELRAELQGLLGQDHLATLETIAKSIQHSDQRNQQLAAWLDAQGLAHLRDNVLAYAELIHTEVRIDQLRGLKCSNCHQFDSSLQNHFAVAKTVCYTCHFINQPFNTNTGRCLSCHEPPTGPVPVHYGVHPATQPTTETTSAAIMMDHAIIIANDINCVSCHIDLIHGTGQVNRRDCENCHDQQRYLKDWDQLTTDVVRTYHRDHAAGQRARCADCHELIDHKLTPLVARADVAGMLAPVRKDCQHCHPDHHREQVHLLLGREGFVEAAEGTPNPMIGSRANCRACHSQPGADPKGKMVLTSTRDACRSCHGKEYEELFTRWQNAIQARLEEAQTLLATVEQQLAETKQPPDRDLDEAARLVARARQNVRLVATANGLHNKNYALMLLDQAVFDLETAMSDIVALRPSPRP